jgi:hypothetical protein
MNPREFCRERDFPTAILLAYAFEPLFFERIALRDLWSGGTGDVLVLADARQIEAAKERREGQMYHLGRRYQLVPAQVSGSFHPKIILRLGQDGGLIWLASGNLTFGGWGGNRELDCAWRFGPGQTDAGQWIGTLLQRIASWMPGGLSHDVVGRVRELPWIGRLAEPVRAEALPLITSAGSSSLAGQIGERWAGRQFDEILILTGSTDEDGAFLQWAHNMFGVERVRVLVDRGRVSFLADAIRRLPMKVSVLSLPSGKPLHAKFYWFTGRDGSAAIMGSANCSRAAWLLPPDSGGNIEAVTTYDAASWEEFSAILSLFDDETLRPVPLGVTPSKSNERPHREATIFGVSEVCWNGVTGEILVTFRLPVPGGAQVWIEIEQQRIALSSSDGSDRVWSTEVADFPSANETMFVVVNMAALNGTTVRIHTWVNDLPELRHSSRGRHIAGTLRDLGRPQNTGDRQRILAELHRISAALLFDPIAFTDPFVRRRSKDEAEGETRKAPLSPVDPDKLIRSITELPSSSSGGSQSIRGTSIGLIGVMRALFEVNDPAEGQNESDKAEEPEENEGEVDPRPPGKSKKGRTQKEKVKDPPPEKHKQQLARNVEDYLGKFRTAEFAARCTATQLVQAAAFPLAVALFGCRGKWVEKDHAQTWAVRLFDVLFRPSGELGVGILEAVHNKYREGGKDEEFRHIVGDGTLWLALLSTLAFLPWSGVNGGLRKALALRSLFEAKGLLDSAETGRMRTLVARLEEQQARALIEVAPSTVGVLGRLEDALKERWSSLLEVQTKQQPCHRANDLLWREGVGWAEVLKETPWSANVGAYLHAKAAVTTLGKGWYVNVSRSGETDAELSAFLSAVQGCGTRR